MDATVDVPAWRALLQADTDGVYLDTANYGRPLRATVSAMRAAMDAWGQGTARWQTDWEPAGEQARGLMALQLGCAQTDLSLQPAVSVGAALVAAGLRQGAVVVAPDDEFSSCLLPVLQRLAEVGGVVRRVPYDRVIEAAAAADVDLVAVSHVRSNDGLTLSMSDLSAAVADNGARILLDATHSAGVLDIDMQAHGIDFVLVAAYKHLLCPRGVAFLAASASAVADTAPLCASWRSVAAPATWYGNRLEDLHPGPRGLDISLAWLCWIGAVPALEALAAIPIDARQRHVLSLAESFAGALELPWSGTHVQTVPVRNAAATAAALTDAGVVGGIRTADVRVSFHLHNDTADVERATSVFRRHLR